MPTPRIFAAPVGPTTEQAIDETAESGTYMGGNGVANAATILVEIGVTGVVDANFDSPVATAEGEQVGRGSKTRVTATH